MKGRHVLPLHEGTRAQSTRNLDNFQVLGTLDPELSHSVVLPPSTVGTCFTLNSRGGEPNNKATRLSTPRTAAVALRWIFRVSQHYDILLLFVKSLANLFRILP